MSDWFFSPLFGKSDDELQEEVQSSSCSSSASSSSPNVSTAALAPTLLTLLFLTSWGTLNVETMKAKLDEEVNRTKRLTGTQRRKRRRNQKRRLLHELHDQMTAAREAIKKEEEEEEEPIGTVDKHGNLLNLYSGASHHEWCGGEDTVVDKHGQKIQVPCCNGDPAVIHCLTCENAYCRKHGVKYQTSDVVVLGSDHDCLKVNQLDGGIIFCRDCSNELPPLRILNIPDISQRLVELDNDDVQDTAFTNPNQRKQFNSSKIAERTVYTEDDLIEPYFALSSHRPLHIINTELESEVLQVPDKKRQKIFRTSDFVRMTQITDDLVCPGCNSKECTTDCPALLTAYPCGIEELEKKRAHLTKLLDAKEIDQAWNYIEGHITFEAHAEGNDARVWKKIGSKLDTRTNAGIKCNVCSRATVGNFDHYLDDETCFDDIEMIPHDRRGKKCGEKMHAAATKYHAVNGAKLDGSCRLDGPPGGIPVLVKQDFFCRLFNIPLRTLQTKIADKRKGRIGSFIRKTRSEAGGSNKLTPMQEEKMEAVLANVDFPQELPHYAPADAQSNYRYKNNVSKAKFWKKYCELHDLDYYNQCKRLNHWRGYDASKKRPTDGVYLADARQHLGPARLPEIEHAYNMRQVVKDKIAGLNDELENMMDLDDDEQAAIQLARKQEILKLIAVLETKLKTMRHCHIAPDVSHSTASRFYHQYAIKIGKIKVDTCKTCDELRLKRNNAAGAYKQKWQDKLDEHQKMANEGYLWRKQDRERAQDPDKKTFTMVIDFGQGLRTPTLKFGAAWYRRILKVNPYIINSYSKDSPVNVSYYMWDETVAGKGADEVISVVHRHIREKMPADTVHMIVHFDGCYGQANNTPFVSFCADLLDETSPFHLPELKRITLKRNPVGHTFCECDTCHGQLQTRLETMCEGQVHSAFTLEGAPDGVWSWQQIIEECGYECVKIEQKDVLNYSDYLMKKLYKKPSKALTGSAEARKRWLFSEQHIFELGRWDIHVGPGKAPRQEEMPGFMRTSENWNFEEPSRVRFWREAGPKIDMDNIHAVREEMAVGYLDEDTQLPLQKYHTLFKLSVLKKYDLWKNARDCGYGDFLEVIYPPLTTEEKAERQKLLKEAAGKRKSGADIEFEADDMEEDEP